MNKQLRDLCQQLLATTTIEQAHQVCNNVLIDLQAELDVKMYFPDQGLITLDWISANKPGLIHIEFGLTHQIRYNGLDVNITATRGLSRGLYFEESLVEALEKHCCEHLSGDDRNEITPDFFMNVLIGKYPDPKLLEVLADINVVTFENMNPNTQYELFTNWNNYIANPVSFNPNIKFDIDEGLDS